MRRTEGRRRRRLLRLEMRGAREQGRDPRGGIIKAVPRRPGQEDVGEKRGRGFVIGPMEEGGDIGLDPPYYLDSDR